MSANEDPVSENKTGVIDADDSRFVCCVCLDPVQDPVVTWLNTGHTTCPVCKAGVTRENVIPLYIRGSSEDPRTKNTEDIPERPSGQRPAAAPQRTGDFMGGNNGLFPNAFNTPYGGITFSAGFGFFPSLFGLQFQNFSSIPQHPRAPGGRDPLVYGPAGMGMDQMNGNMHQHQVRRELTQDEIVQNSVSRFLLMMGILVILCLIVF